MDRHQTNQPLETLRDGNLKAVVWQNEGENGPYHSVTLAKIYEDRNGKLQETSSFSQSELLRIAELAREAHGVVRDARRQLSQERQSDPVIDRGDGRRAGGSRGEPAREARPRRFRNAGGPGLER